MWFLHNYCSFLQLIVLFLEFSTKFATHLSFCVKVKKKKKTSLINFTLTWRSICCTTKADFSVDILTCCFLIILLYLIGKKPHSIQNQHAYYAQHASFNINYREQENMSEELR